MSEPEHRGSAQQLQLLHTAARSGSRRPAGDLDPAEVDPVAKVLLDVGLAHLDRPFDYAVPASMSDDARPGVRVKVRFAGRDTAGYIVARAAAAEHEGRLAPIKRVVSAEPVLTPQILELAQAVAKRYAGTVHDVLRLAIPPRHARAERALDDTQPAAAQKPGGSGDPEAGAAWQRYPAGPALLHRLADGQAPAAAWLATPTTSPELDWPAALAEAATATLSGGRGTLIVVPDHRDVDRVAASLTQCLGASGFVRLTADQGPQARYTAWLKLLRGHVRCVVGTRAAAFAPVADLGLVAWWDDGDDLLCEPRAPYPHVREVLRLRARQEQCAMLSGGFARSVAIQRWVQQSVAQPVQAPRDRGTLPRVHVAGDDWEVARSGPAALARIPSSAWQAAHDALADGPVLVQVPLRGYVRSLRCQDCRTPARCPRCHGPLHRGDGGTDPACRWCGTVCSRFVCAECGGRRLRAGSIGARRTAEELGRAFSSVPVVRSGAGEVVSRVGPEPALVIATPGAEPLADGGYAATLLLDGWALVDRPTLDAGQEALRRWLAAAALTRPGASVVLCSVARDEPVPAVQALVRWAPEWFAQRELADREELALPPAALMTELTGSRDDVQEFAAQLPDDVERIGPLDSRGDDATCRLLLRVPWPQGPALTEALRAARATRSARKRPGTVQVRVDPAAGLL